MMRFKMLYCPNCETWYPADAPYLTKNPNYDTPIHCNWGMRKEVWGLDKVKVVPPWPVQENDRILISGEYSALAGQTLGTLTQYTLEIERPEPQPAGTRI